MAIFYLLFFISFFFFYGDIWEKSRYRAAKIALPDQVLLETSDFRGIRYGSTDARLPSRLNSYQMTRVRARVVYFLKKERKKKMKCRVLFTLNGVVVVVSPFLFRLA